MMRFAFRLFFYTGLLLMVVLLFIQFSGLYRIYDIRNRKETPVNRNMDETEAEVLNRHILEVSSSNTMITFDQLEEPLYHASETIRYRALKAVKNDMSERFTRYLIDRVIHDPSPSIRSYALSLLSTKSNQGILPIVVACLKDPASEVQDAALTYLADNQRKDAVTAIIETLKRTIPTSSHLRALGMLGGTEAIQFLIDFAVNNADRREEVLFNLSKTGDASITYILNWMKHHQSASEINMLLPVFRYFDSSNAFECLKLASESSDAEYRKIGLEAMGYLDWEGVHEYLNKRVTKEKDSSVQQVMRDALERHLVLCLEGSINHSAF